MIPSKYWVIDPVTKEPSVSLTILTVAFTAVVVAGAFEMTGVVKSTSIFLELFFSSAALYFGRRFSFKGQNFSSEKAEDISNKLENK
jgi:hypothetical protein